MRGLLAYIDGREQEMLAFLEQIVNMDSGTLDKAGIDRLGSFLAERLETLGFAVERARQTQYGDHVIGRKAGSGSRSILFVGHIDTVFSSGTAAVRPFRIDGGRAYGPGVLDMKGGVATLIFALDALKATGHPSYEQVGMTVIFNTDEEVGSPSSRELIEAEARKAQTACVFEPARPGGEYVIARKGVGRYRVEVKGRAAHAGVQPEQGRSAVLELAHKIIALHALNDFSRGTTVNVGVIRGGDRSNVVAAEASGDIDVRVRTLAEAQRLEASFQEIAGSCALPDTTTTITGRLGRGPMEQTPQARRLFEKVQEIGRGLKLELKGIATGGGSDGNLTAQHTPTVDGMGPQGSEAHSDREFIEVATLVERVKVTALILASWPETIAQIG